MTKVDIRRLDSVTTNDTTATQLINENFEALQEAIENTLSRDGTTPNFMDADLDLNSYKIINAGTPTNNTDLVTKEYFDEHVGDAAGYAADAEASANRAAIAAQAAQGYSTAASGAADVAQRARDFIESDPGFVAVSTDLLLGEDSSIKKTSEDLTNIDTVAGSIANVNAVGTDIANVNAVADDLTNIDSVVTNMTDINNVADDLTKIVAVADDLTKIDNVADDLTNIDNVADDLTNIDAVADNITNVNAVANNETNINAVNANKTNIDSVATNIADVNSVATDIAKVTAVADDLTNIDAVNANKTNIDAVAGNNSNITVVSGSIANVNAVGTDIANVNAVAGDITNINAVAADLANIDAASDYAAEAKQWAIGDPSEPVGNSSKYWAEYAESIAQTVGDPANKDLSNLSTTGNNRFVNLQQQIDAIVASSDVFDIVGTYAELQAYDITTVPVNDIIKVLVDSTHNDAATYYRCVENNNVKSWSYIGSEGAYYTKGEADNKFSTIAGTGSALDYTGTTLSLQNSSGTTLSSVTIQSSPDLDGKSITKNLSQELQTVGVIDSNNTTNAIKTWTGTRQQYDAILSKDANTLYNITDDTDVSLTILEALYPVGSIYITTASTCPLSTLISGSTWELVSSGRVLQGADNGHSAGTTIEAGLPNITGGLIDVTGGGSLESTGAFNLVGVYTHLIQSGSSGKGGSFIFNASRSSSIYGNSTTVQPPAYVVNIYRRIA